METRKYKLGDRWHENFDYEGMLQMGLTANPSWKIDKLEKLLESFEDVNYQEAGPLAIAILHKRGNRKNPKYYPNEPEYKNATEAIREFHKRIKKQNKLKNSSVKSSSGQQTKKCKGGLKKSGAKISAILGKKTYCKIHKLKKVADAHAKLIKKRGGKVKQEGNKLTYSF